MVIAMQGVTKNARKIVQQTMALGYVLFVMEPAQKHV